MYYEDDAPASSGCLRSALLIAVALVALGAFVYFGLDRASANLNPFNNAGLPTVSNPLAPAPTVISVDRPTLLREMRSLNRWETTTGVYDKVITAGQEGSTFYNFFRGDKLLLVANGEVIAGFDLTKLQPSDITMAADGTATVNLPPAEILVSRLNNNLTYVANRETGVFTNGNQGLESEARRVAEQQIIQRACETGILTRATQDGKQNMETLIKALGVKNVIINASPGACVAPPTTAGSAPQTTP